MFTFLLVLLVLDSFVLIAAILLQAGKGNGLAATFGGVSSSADSLLGTRQAGNLLTKTSWWGAAIFLALSYILSLASTRQRAPKSVLDQAFTQPPAPATAPATPNANSAIPLPPVTPTPGTAPATTTPAPAKKP
jgi:preprotein translocase subunit SecG